MASFLSRVTFLLEGSVIESLLLATVNLTINESIYMGRQILFSRDGLVVHLADLTTEIDGVLSFHGLQDTVYERS